VTTTFIAPGENLVQAVAAQLLASRSTIAQATVVFPGRRPSHFLRRALARELGTAFQPPRVLSMDELVMLIVRAQDERAGRVRPGLDSIDAVAILYDLQLAAPMGGGAFMTLDSFFPLGMRIWGDIEELLIERVPAASVRGVQALVSEEVPAGARGRLQELAHFYESFYQEAERRGYSTRASRFRQAAENLAPGDVDGDGPLILAGFSFLTACERSLFTTLAGWQRVHAVFQQGPGLDAWLKDLPVALPPTTSAALALPRARFTSSSDTHGQVFALGAALGEPDEQTLIVLPRAETLFPLLRHALSRFEKESYNISLPYPLERTPLYGFLDSLMELVGSMEGELVYLPSYMAFVLHPYVKNLRLGGSAEATRVLFHTLEDRLGETPTRRFALLSDIEGDDELFRRAARRIGAEDETAMAGKLARHLAGIHERTVGSFRSFRSVREFAERCLSLISWVHDESTAREHPNFTEFAESFAGALATIARSLMADKIFNDAGSSFALLRRFLAIQYQGFPGTPLHGMQVLGVLETRNLAFRRVFVLDANEGVFPDTGASASLLPYAVRLALKLPTVRDREALAAYHFSLLAAGAQEMHLFSIVSGDKERSRFVERLLWEEEKSRAPGAAAPDSTRSVQYRVTLEAAAPAAIAKTDEVTAWLAGRAFSATGLSTYLQCPLKFYYREVLRLAEREEPGAEVDQAQIGSFVHAVLHDYFSSRTGRALAAADLDTAAMAVVVDRLFGEWFGPADGGSGRLLREQVKRHLVEFLDGYAKPLAGATTLIVRDLEQDLTADWRGFKLRGRVDAVQTRGGRPVLIDYKTSSNPTSYAVKWKKLDLEDRASWQEAFPTLQLPFYLLLYAPRAGVAPAEMDALFLLLGKTRMDQGIELPLFDAKHPAADWWPGFETVIHALLQEIVTPGVPFEPARDLAKACAYCPFTGICGTGAYRKA
jgi:ATP-dependent helicase/nuclease subunit B